MGIEEYKVLISKLIESSKDLEYIIALYSFAESYPDRSRASTHSQNSVLNS